MEFNQEEIKNMWLKAVEEALVIWKDRACGRINISDCPLCDISSLLSEHEDCSSCILKDCFTSPYGMWQYYGISSLGAKKSASDMVKMLEAYRDGDMELFARYLKYWDGDIRVCVFEERI